MQVYHLNGSVRTFLARGRQYSEHPNFRDFGLLLGTELVDLVDRDHPGPKDNGNAKHPMEFYVEREHASEEEAADFYFLHAMALLPCATGTFVFVSEARWPALDYYYLHDAILESVKFSEPLQGIATVATYRISGGRLDRSVT